MRVLRIVADIACADPSAVHKFYQEVLGLDLLMDQGWIATYGSGASMKPQITFASEGGAGTRVPDLSIEVDDVDEALERVTAAGFPVVYGPANEDWGVRRFFTRDPFGKLVNILAHRSAV